MAVVNISDLNPEKRAWLEGYWKGYFSAESLAQFLVDETLLEERVKDKIHISRWELLDIEGKE